MTIENARKMVLKISKLSNIERTLRDLKKSKESLSDGVIVIGGQQIYSIPIDIEKEVFDLLVKRLKEERDKITAEIEAM